MTILYNLDTRICTSKRQICNGCFRPRAVLSRRPVSTGSRRGVRKPTSFDVAARSRARLCADCAGVAPLARCPSSGIEDRIYQNGRCVHCALAERAARLLGDHAPIWLVSMTRSWPQASPIRPQLAPLRPSRPTSSPISPRGDMPLTHDALDAHPHPRAAGFLRQLSVAQDLLAERDEALIALEAWVSERLDSIDDPAHSARARQALCHAITWMAGRRVVGDVADRDTGRPDDDIGNYPDNRHRPAH